VALGARRLHVVVMVLRDGLVPVGAGITLGLVLAVAGRNTIAAQLHDVPAADPVTLTTVVILLFMVALCACYVPARRAARVDPAVTLRAE
jgi:ABC-type antimicrobial peptide transport system permease subunit